MGAKHLILGCGYTGLVLAQQRHLRGEAVIGTSRTEDRRVEIEATGAAFEKLDLDCAPSPAPGEKLASVTLLAPPPDDLDLAARRVRYAVRRAGDAPVVVLTSTAVYGETRGTVTERTHPAPRTDRERAWAMMDAAALYLRREGHPVRVVRTPAIYGPGRDLRAQLLTGQAFVIKGAPVSSRIHVEDLARLLIYMTTPSAPPLLIACDDLPAPTQRVYEEAARLLDVPGPKSLSADEARERFTNQQLSMRLKGRSCRSVVKPLVPVRLRYPTYREGLRACLVGQRA